MIPASAAAQQASSLPATTPVPRAPQESGDPIVVTGKSPSHRAEVRLLTDAVTPTSSWGEPLARFRAPLCVGSAGLDRRTLEQIGQRLARNAVAAGIPLGGARCAPNIFILFVDGADAEIARLRRSSPGLFGDRTPREIASLLDEPGPVRAWSNSEIRSSDGDPISFRRSLSVPIASILATPIRRDVLGAVVVVERSAALGKTTDQLGDYLAMRALAGVRPQRAQGKATILTLFDAAASPAPAAMTAFDRGYLQGLYASAPNAEASTTKKRIVRSILAAETREVDAADK